MHVRMSGVPLYPAGDDGPLDHAIQDTSAEEEPVDGRNSELETVRYNLVREYHDNLLGSGWLAQKKLILNFTSHAPAPQVHTEACICTHGVWCPNAQD